MNKQERRVQVTHPTGKTSTMPETMQTTHGVDGAKQRVQDELVYLSEKLTKLDAFICGGIFYSLNQEQQDLLFIQQAQMKALILTLTWRLKIWEQS